MSDVQPAMNEDTPSVEPEEFEFIRDLRTMPDDIMREYYAELRTKGKMTERQARSFIRTLDDYRNGKINRNTAIDNIDLICGDLDFSTKIIDNVPAYIRQQD